MAKVLVIDDDDLFRIMILSALKKDGHHVQEAPDGDYGLKLFRQAPVDLVITDIVMPEREGIDVIITIRRESHDLPIIAMSGGGCHSSASYLDMAKVLGANRVFDKPLHIKTFLQSVRTLTTKTEPHANMNRKGPS